jgi:hypothetical protein
LLRAFGSLSRPFNNKSIRHGKAGETLSLEERSNVAIHTGMDGALSFQKIQAPHGLQRRTVQAMTSGGIEAFFFSTFRAFQQ